MIHAKLFIIAAKDVKKRTRNFTRLAIIHTLIMFQLQDECGFFLNSLRCPKAHIRFVSRIITRHKKGDLPVAFNGSTFNDVNDRKLFSRVQSFIIFLDMHQIVESPEREKEETFSYKELIKFMGADNVPVEKEFVNLYRKVLTFTNVCLQNCSVQDEYTCYSWK